MNWATIVASAVGSILVWFVTNVLFTPWVEERRRLAAAKRRHALMPFSCDCCAGGFPGWFIDQVEATSDDGHVTPVYACRECQGLVSGFPRPYETESNFTWRLRRQKVQRFFLASRSLVAFSRVRAGR
jgi:hypothetical protein